MCWFSWRSPHSCLFFNHICCLFHSCIFPRYVLLSLPSPSSFPLPLPSLWGMGWGRGGAGKGLCACLLILCKARESEALGPKPFCTNVGRYVYHFHVIPVLSVSDYFFPFVHGYQYQLSDRGHSV